MAHDGWNPSPHAARAEAAVILSVRQYRQKYAAECGKARAASQFKAGKTGNAGGKPKAQADLILGPPEPVQDLHKKPRQFHLWKDH